MIADLIAELNRRYERWSFTGDMDAWYQNGGAVLVRKIEVVTPSGPDSFVFGGRRIYVRQGEPTGENPHMLIPKKAAVSSSPRPERLAVEPAPGKVCQHRGEQIAEIRCDQCGQGRGQMKPVYACAIHGRCTHRLERRGQESQDPPIRTCIGCPDGPWAA